MPRRPSKAWWTRTVAALRKNRDVDDPERVAGWLWAHGMKRTTKRDVLRAMEGLAGGAGVSREDETMYAKGYRYRIDVPTAPPYNGPLYAKTAMQIGPILRDFPELSRVSIVNLETGKRLTGKPRRLAGPAGVKRDFTNLDEMIRSRDYDSYIADKLGNDLFINDPDRADRIWKAAEEGGNGSTHGEEIDDWRDFLSTLRVYDPEDDDPEWAAKCDITEETRARIEKAIDTTEEYLSSKGLLDKEIG